MFHVMSVAIKKATTLYYLELLARLNLKPSIIDVPTFSNANLILTPSSEILPLSAVVDVGSQGIELSLLKNRHIDFSKNVPFNDPDFKRGFFQASLDESYYESVAKGLAKIIVEQLHQLSWTEGFRETREPLDIGKKSGHLPLLATEG